MERREFVKLGFLAAIATVAGIQIVQNEEIFILSNRPHPSTAFTEESIWKAIEEFERIERYRMKMITHAYRYRMTVQDWKGLIGNV